MDKAINEVFSFNSMHAFSSYKFLKSCICLTIFGDVTIDVNGKMFHFFVCVCFLVFVVFFFFKISLNFKLLYLRNAMSKLLQNDL